MSDDRTIYQRMIDVLGELPAIGKEQRNQQQGFNFRGVDDVLNALNPLLAKHGVFYLPEVLERIGGERTTKNGGVMYVTNLHVRYRFYGAGGDSVEASCWGEGTDSGDKATPKAMTGAMKYTLFQAFAISTQEAAKNDADAHTPPESVPTALAALIKRHDTLPSAAAESLTEFVQEKVWNGAAVPLGELPEAWWEHYGHWLETAEKKVSGADGGGVERTPPPAAPDESADSATSNGKGEHAPDATGAKDDHAAAGGSRSAPTVPPAGVDPATGEIKGEPMTAAQRRTMFALLNGAGITEPDAQRAAIGAVLDREVTSRGELSKQEATVVIDSLKQGPAVTEPDTEGAATR